MAHHLSLRTFFRNTAQPLSGNVHGRIKTSRQVLQANQCRQFGERLSVKMRNQSGAQGIIDRWRRYACGFGVLQRQPFFIAKERALPPVRRKTE
jgi:hypothetical protein